MSQVATSTQLVQDVGADSMSLTLTGTGIAIGIAVFLLGVGFAWRKITHKAVGKKF